MNGQRRLAWLTLLGAPALVAGGVYAATGHGVPCPFLMVTGWLCPLCGGSRMGAALLAGDLSAAWGWNPFLLALMTVLALVWLWTLFCLAARWPAGLPGPFARLDRLAPATLLVLVGVPGVVFGAVRNLA